MLTKIILSTDGKHTVTVEAEGDQECADDALVVAETLFAQIEEQHGKCTVDHSQSTNKSEVNSPQAQNESTPVCGVHQKPMVWKPGGVSRMGKPYKAFWSCSERNPDGGYCNFKPQR